MPTVANSANATILSHFLYLLAINYDLSEEHVVYPTFERLAPTAKTLLKQPLDKVMSPPPPRSSFQDSGESQWEELQAIVNRYMELDLPEDGAQLLAASLPQVPDVNSRLWKRWDLWFPFTKSLVTFLTDRPSSEMPTLVKPFISSLAYTIAGHLARTRPAKHPTWVQSKYRRSYDYGNGADSCFCRPCQDLQRFLDDPRRRVGKFSYNEQTRRHLTIEVSAGDFQVNVERNGSPHTLVLTKTNRRWEREAGEWKTAISDFRQHCRSFDVLLRPIGFSVTDAAGLDAQLVAAGASEGALEADQPLKPMSATGLSSALLSRTGSRLAAMGPVAGVKRKAYVLRIDNLIDLTED